MGFLSSAGKLDAASKIKHYNEQALSAYNSFIAYKKNISDLLELMRTNEDYSQSDVDEVQTLIEKLEILN